MQNYNIFSTFTKNIEKIKKIYRIISSQFANIRIFLYLCSKFTNYEANSYLNVGYSMLHAIGQIIE